MAQTVPVRCPACRREHALTSPDYPCACGAPVCVPVVADGTPVQVRHLTWSDTWAEVACQSCGRPGQWPRPELHCPCGATVRLTEDADHPRESPPGPDRPAFRPPAIRTAHDAVACAAQFLRWLGFQEVRSRVPGTATGPEVRGPGVVGLVDPTTAPTGVRELETLWLHAATEGLTAVAFSLAGYERAARSRADELDLPLFVLDLTGTPKPVNDPADTLLRKSA